MSEIKSGVLPALIDYYQRLEVDPNQAVADFGFSREKIHFCVVLEPNGALSEPGLVDVRGQSEKGKPIPTPMVVPDGGGRSGTGIKPFFCWDNTGYVLGRDNKGKPDRVENMFAAFRDLHLEMGEFVGDDDGYAALCCFLGGWNPADAEKLPGWEDAAGKNVVFKLRGREGYIHQSEAVKRAWRSALTSQAPGDRGISLVTGEDDELARLHPMISGVSGANTTGAAIVSFNLDAFESYDLVQSYNAPVGVRDAFRYTTALNRLLAEPTRRVRIGDATVVFWSDRATEAEDFFAHVIDESAENKETVDRVAAFLSAARQGRLADVVADPAAPFYILGLSPNASRISVRFWLAGAVQQFVERLAQHATDLEMTGARDSDPPLMIRRLIYETMPEGTAANREKQIAQLAGELTRAVLTGTAYPQAIFSGIIRRLRADQTMNHRRAAMLKACIVRNARLAGRKKEAPVSLNRDHPDPAYQIGRLFAALEKTQEDALPGLNKTIKNGYFGTASATPCSVFPRLIRLHQHHIEKLDGGLRVNRERLIQEICSRIDRFPAHLPLEQQGMFHIGYYHQRQDFFTSKKGSGASGERLDPALEEVTT
jgi:CRISPR-associated protein Csd1